MLLKIVGSKYESFLILSLRVNGNHLAIASAVQSCKPYPQSAQIGTLHVPFQQGPHTRLSKAIFQPSKFRKDCGEGVADHVEPLLDLGAVRPQEGVLRQLGREGDR
jgi:hypothetical protein